MKQLECSPVDGLFFSTLTHPVEFILMRHGESEGNAGGVFQGRTEYPLTATGRKQAKAQGRLLRLRKSCADPALVRVYTSPLSRALETASILSTEAGFPAPRLHDNLIELDVGIWSGKSWDEVRREDPELYQKFRSRSWEVLESAETPRALYLRAWAAWSFLRDEACSSGAAAIIAVTHGGFLQWLVRSTFGYSAWLPLVPMDNCGTYILKAEPTGNDGAFIAWLAMNESPDTSF